MILVTWNCNARKDLSALSNFTADLLVLTEPRLANLPPEYKRFWIGDEGESGIAIIPGPGTTWARVQDIPNLPSSTVLTYVTGTVSFLLLAVWTRKKPDNEKYIRGLHRAIDLCETLIASHPTVILGDFNSNAIWDDRVPSDRNHTALVRRLTNLGLESAYHAFFREAHGQETRHTYYQHYRQKHLPFHIDYCFLPKQWAVADVVVGSFDEWRAKSDHMPLIVSVRERDLSAIA